VQTAKAVGVTDRQYQRFEAGVICLGLRTSAPWRTTSACRWTIWRGARMCGRWQKKN